MKKDKRLKHALHNEKVCELIHQNGGFPDWVITTAYYTAHHIVSYKIFPFKEITSSGHQFELKTLDEYYRFKKLECGKHQALADLVSAAFPAISPDYDWLMDLCLKARYKNYQQTTPDAQKALDLLAIIKAAVGLPAAGATT